MLVSQFSIDMTFGCKLGHYIKIFLVIEKSIKSNNILMSKLIVDP